MASIYNFFRCLREKTMFGYRRNFANTAGTLVVFALIMKAQARRTYAEKPLYRLMKLISQYDDKYHDDYTAPGYNYNNYDNNNGYDNYQGRQLGYDRYPPAKPYYDKGRGKYDHGDNWGKLYDSYPPAPIYYDKGREKFDPDKHWGKVYDAMRDDWYDSASYPAPRFSNKQKSFLDSLSK